MSAPLHAPVHGLVDADGRLIEADPALARLNAQAGGEADGLLAVPQLAALARLVRRLGVPVSRGVMVADGPADAALWVRAGPAGDGVRLAIVDWSEQERGLAQPTREQVRDFARAAGEWRWEADAGLRLVEAPVELALIAGIRPDDLDGQPLTRLFVLLPGPDGAIPLIEALAEQRDFDGQRATLKGGDGRALTLDGMALRGGGGGFSGFAGTATAVDAEETPAPVAAASGVMEHHLGEALRAPLDRIIADAEAIRLQGDGPLRRSYAAYAEDIASAGRHLLALVGDLVDLSAIESEGFRPEVEPVDLADVARRAAGLLGVRAGDKGVTIAAPDDRETLAAQGDFGRVMQILVNLIGNAVRYALPGSTVTIALDRGEGAAVRVADAGRGIAEADQTRIFEKFERVDPSEPGGTGLGLYISRRLARAMGGDILLASVEGEGAAFTLVLPLA